MEENEKLKNEIKNINDRNSEKTSEYVRNLEDKETADKYKETFEKIESKIYDVIQENDKLSEIIK